MIIAEMYTPRAGDGRIGFQRGKELRETTMRRTFGTRNAEKQL